MGQDFFLFAVMRVVVTFLGDQGRVFYFYFYFYAHQINIPAFSWPVLKEKNHYFYVTVHSVLMVNIINRILSAC